MVDKTVEKRIASICSRLELHDVPVNTTHANDAALWATSSFDIELDPWQIKALQSTSRRSLWNIHRQAGKSSVAALKGLHRMIYQPKALVLMVSPSLRQSSELFRKLLNYYDELNNPPGFVEDTKLSAELTNGSRCVSLPGSEATVRGYSAPSLILEDESARVSDEYFNAVAPMLAVSNGQLVLLSTPFGQRGHFFEIATDPDNGWEKFTIPATDCPRISKEFLDAQRRVMSDAFFRSEFLCEFTSTEDAVFAYEHVDNAFSDAVDPLIIEGVSEW
ncbi:MAG: terminase family protein [Methanotrichaceae archaeon]